MLQSPIPHQEAGTLVTAGLWLEPPHKAPPGSSPNAQEALCRTAAETRSRRTNQSATSEDVSAIDEVLREAAERRHALLSRGDRAVVEAGEADAFLAMTEEQYEDAIRSGAIPSQVQGNRRVFRVQDLRVYLRGQHRRAEEAAAGYTRLRAELDLDDDIPTEEPS